MITTASETDIDVGGDMVQVLADIEPHMSFGRKSLADLRTCSILEVAQNWYVLTNRPVSMKDRRHNTVDGGPVLSNRMLGHCLLRAGIRRESLADLRYAGTMTRYVSIVHGMLSLIRRNGTLYDRNIHFSEEMMMCLN